MPSHKTNIILFYLAVTIFASLLLTFTIYLIWAQGHNSWPFYKKPTPPSKNPKLEKASFSYDVSSSSNSSIGIAPILIFLIFFIFVGVMIYFIVKANMERYKIAGQALKHGHEGVAVAALAPEIGEGIGNAIGRNNRYY
jgi:hypothetical protein